MQFATPGGGGFIGAGFFVDGIHHEATLGNDRFLQRVTTLDVTPQALYDVSPFRDPPA